MLERVRTCNVGNSGTQVLSLSCVMNGLLQKGLGAINIDSLTESGIEIANADQNMVLKLKNRSADYELSFIRTGSETAPMTIYSRLGNFGIICGDRPHSQIVLNSGRKDRVGEYAYANLNRTQLEALLEPGHAVGYLPKPLPEPDLRATGARLAIA